MAFTLNNSEHAVGDRRCPECWRGYPMKCLCGGLIHAQFISESWENIIKLVHLCDLCGENYKFPVFKAPKKFTKGRFNKRK